MTLTVEAVFENGVLKPLNPLNLSEQQKVQLVVNTDLDQPVATPKTWHWAEAQQMDDAYAGEVAKEVIRQRREN